MLGTRVEQAELRASGVAGDRGWALVDQQTGKVASAKQPRLWRSLLQLRAEYHGGAGQPGNPQLLRALARSNRIPLDGFGPQTCAGVYARVISPGRVRTGDEVRIGPDVSAAAAAPPYD
jgi:uncharacterized protein YcbX